MKKIYTDFATLFCMNTAKTAINFRKGPKVHKLKSLLVLFLLSLMSGGIAQAQWVPAGLAGGFIFSLTDNGGSLFAGTGSGVSLTTNSGSSWSTLNTGLTNTNIRTIAVMGSNLFTGTNGGGVFHSTNNGSSWISANNGLTNLTVHRLAVNGTSLFAATYGGGIFVSGNNGSTWSPANTGLTNLDVYTFAFSGTNLFAGTNNGVFLSTNNGASWTQVSNGLTNTDVRSLVFSGTTLFAGTNGGGVFRSLNNAANWTQMNTGLTNFTINTLAACGTNLYAGTNSGLFQSLNNGTSWTSYNSGLTNTTVTAMAVSGTRLFAGTFGGGIFSASDCSASANTGSICGMKFNDLNGDGLMNGTETGLSGWTISLTTQNAAGPVTVTTTTGADGTYCFNSLAAGSYTVSETQKSGWSQTFPASPGTHAVSLTAGQNVTGKDFGNKQLLGSICGMKFNDLNGDGLMNGTETGLSGWTISLTTQNAAGSVTVTTTTGADGTYCFSSLAAGSYTVSETQKSGWSQTFPASPGTHAVSLTAGQNVTGKDFGNKQLLGSICGMKFNDLNGDGLMNGTETGLSGWTISLTTQNAAGPVTVTTTTGADGTYCFSSLTAGSYTVSETQKSGWSQTFPASPGTHAVSLTAGLNVTGKDFGNKQLLGSICGMKFNDINGDGLMNGTETGLSGWTISLTTQNAAGPVTVTTTTGADGTYCFSSLTAGSYTVSETQKSGWSQTFPASPGTHAVSLTAGLNVTGKDFGNKQLLGSICGMKFNDLNGDGLMNGTETGLSGWTISLTTQNAAGSVTVTTTTGADGTYCFSSLAAGSYTVSETQKSGWSQTFPASPGTHAVSLTAGQNVTGKDFGNKQLLGSICGMKFNDLNGDGLMNGTETGLSGWTISLTTQNAAGPITVTTTTGADGTYCFNSLTAGSYTVSETQKSGWSQTFPASPGTHAVSLTAGQNVTGKDFGNKQLLGSICGIKFNDLNGTGDRQIANEQALPNWEIKLTYNNASGTPVTLTTTTNQDGSYCFNNLTAGTYVISETNQAGWQQIYPYSPGTYTIVLTAGQSRNGFDFANQQTPSYGSICGMKFNDLNGDGLMNGTETGLSGWTISLTTQNAAGPVTVTTTTGADGTYCFSSLTAGSYTVSETQKSGWSQTFPASPGTHAVSLTAGLNVTGKDFGNKQLLGSICGMKFNDLNGDGLMNGTETGLSGWTISLTTQNAAGPVTVTTTTGADGTYCFNSLTAGSYTVSETQKSGWSQTFPASPGTHAVSLTAGLNVTGKDFGNKQLLGSICGMKFNDLNGDGLMNGTETGLSGWTISLTTQNAAGPVTVTTTTGADGTYCFSSLTAGSYTVSETQKSGWSQTFPASPGTHAVSLTAGQNVTGKDFGNKQLPGSICGMKFNDINGDGLMNGTETGLSGWTISLTTQNAAGPVTVTTTTGADGTYCFNSLTAGSYTVSETQKSGWSQTFPASPGTHAVSLTAGQNVTGKDFGNKANATELGNACVTWDLLSSTAVSTTSGTITGQTESIGGGTSAPFMSVFSPYIANGQKLGVLGGWLPGGLDLQRYIEFKVSPLAGNSLNVTSVSFNYGDNPQLTNFNIINSQVFYSINGTSWTQLGSTLSYLNTTMTAFSMTISGGVQVSGGQTFYLRINPYSPSGSIAGTVSFAVHNRVVICGTTSKEEILPTVTPGGPDRICQSAVPSAITLSGAGVGGSATTGAWTITSGGGTLSTTAQTATPASVTYTPAANYSGTVILTLTSNGSPAASATRTITITALPTAPAAITGTLTLCAGSTTQLADATSGGVWSSGSPAVATVNASTGLVTGLTAGTATITYTIGGVVVLCTNSVTQTVTVNASPTITGTTPASRCGSGTLTLGATASSGTINWYAAPTGGTSLGTGTSFTTPVLSTTTTYYTDATSGGCTTGTRTAVVATINALPAVSAPGSISVGSTVSLSPNTGGTWTSSNPLVATVSGSGLVTGVSTGTVTFTFTNTLTGCSATTPSVTVTASGNKPCIYLCNTGFELFTGVTPPTGYGWFSQASIPCWKTTATDGQIEIWHSGFGAVPAHSGTYFAEINATQNATLYQTFTATALQTVIASFWHRGRYAGVDVMKVSIVAPNGTITSLGTYSDANTAWNFYSTASYPITATGTYTLKFESVSSNNGTGPRDGGNFLDDISVTCPSSICGIKYNDLNGDGQKQATEPVLPNWEITLTGPLTLTATTGADGSYCFNNLPAGSYTVQETQQDGWMQTAPAAPGTHSFNLMEGQQVTGKDFGNRQRSNASCTNFEDGTNGGWQLNHALSSIITDGTNHYLQTTDQSGASSLFNTGQPLTGDWTDLLVNGCGSLCFDVNFLYAGDSYGGVNPPSTVTPHIVISGNGFSAAFIVTNPILAGSGWHSYCAPLANLNLDGTLPSNADGYWVMSTGSNSDWNSLLSNVTQVRLPVDPSSYQGEKFGYDNICLKNTGDCVVPCCEKATVVPVLDANGKATCSAKITATCGVRSIEVTVSNGTLSTVSWNCPTAIPTGYTGLSSYTFVPGNCIPELTTSVNAITSGIVTITYDITFSSGEKCRKTIEVNCGAPCCDQVKVERVLDAAGKTSCSAKISANCELRSIAVNVTNGTLSSVNWNCTTAIPTGYIGLSAYTFAPGSCIPELTTSVDAIASGIVTITYDITFANGEKCLKKIDLDCSVPMVICCDKVKAEPVVDATGKASCCAKITATCEVKSIAVIVSNGTLSAASWNCPATIPTGYVGQTAYTFVPESCTPILTTCVNAIQSGLVTITYDIIFTNGETCQKTIRLDCAVASDCVTPPTGMVLWLPGDGNASDISGLNNHGSLAGATTYSTGKVANAFRAGKYTDYISVPDNSSLNFGTGNFSADAWMNTTDNIHFISIVDKSVSVGNNMTGYRLFIYQGKLSFQMGDGSAPLSQWVPTVQLADGVWHLVAVTVDRKATDGGKLYIDGSLVLTFDPTGKPGSISNTIPLTLLGNTMVNYTASDHFSFHLDEVELFNRVITGTEITSIYNAGSAGKCKLGSICGTKFNDLNGNGRRDKDEPGIPEWKITIGGTAEQTTYTDREGNYCFYNLKPGEYKIGEEVRPGWQQMVPAAPGTYTLSLPAGQNLTGLDFGNRLLPQTGSICGSKFNDLNGNGKRDEGEPGIGDWTILLGGGATELKATTDKNGDFCFENLKPGTYKLGEENRVGWLQMKPAGGSYNIILSAGQILAGQDFGNMLDSKPAAICGIKFNDLNGNGSQDLTEPGLPNWTISLNGSATMTATTDGKGRYCFTGLKPGTYTVSEVNQPLWNQTSPHPTGNYTVTLTAGQYLDNLNFGNQHELECVTPPILMLGWWPGDDHVNDLTLNGNYGTLVNGATFAPGKVDKAFSLMGTTDYVNIPDRPQLNPGNGDFTIDAWIQTSEAKGTFAILDKRGLDANLNISGYGLFVVDGHLQLKLSDSAGNGFGATLYNDNSTMIADGQWHFVAATVAQGSGHAVTLIIDGVVVNTNTSGLPTLSYSNNVDLRIGEAYFAAYSQSVAGHFHNFQGLIDEVEFMYGARSAAELAGIYNAGSAGKCKPAVLPGSICGSKFNDLNGNGIRDARGDGEPGIANWTIRLTGAATLTTTTDANGNFCFNNLAPGQYTLAEVNQAGWIQTTPLNPNTFTVTLEPGAHIEVLNFGNKIDPTVNCVTPPSGMVGWWPADGHASDISGYNNHGTLVGAANYSSGKVAQGLNVINETDYITVPDHSSLNFGTGNLSIDAWVNTKDTIGVLSVVNKIGFSGSITNLNVLGYALLIQRGKLRFIWGYGPVFQDLTTSNVLLGDGKWHFVAVTVDRKNKTGGKLYVDGNLVLTFDPTAITATITNTASLVLAKPEINVLSQLSNQVDEVEIFNRVITNTEIASIYNAGSSGKCKLGSICGMKFNDLNGNGKKDDNEPGISDWQINLSGSAAQSVRTDKDGSYCFTNLVTGEYQIGEELRGGWTQTAPGSPGKFTVKLASSQHLRDYNFGNKLQNQTDCVEPPSGMVAWWPLDETSGTTAVDLAGYNNAGTRKNNPATVAGKVLSGLQFDGADDYVEAPDQSELNFGTGDFSFEAWIKTSDHSGMQMLLSKRSSTGYGVFLNAGHLGLVLSVPSIASMNWTPAVFVADGNWHHIAVTVSRTNSQGIIFYLDGVATPYGDPTPYQGSLTNAASLTIGKQQLPNPSFNFNGILDEIKLFNRVITKAEIVSIVNAGSSGNCRLGSICGTKYNDLNGNGRRDEGEPGIPEWQIMLDGAVRLTTITDKDGNYCFTNLLPGDYKILEELRPEWQQKAPATGSYGVTLTTGQNITGKDFGNMLNAQLGSICGVKYNDLNGNGIRDKDEPGIGDWTILIGGTADFKISTDKNGEFCLNNLKPGVYKIGEQLRDGWIQTAPSERYFTIELKEGQHVTNLEFGNMSDPKTGSICGMKFNDVNGNGIMDNGEPGIPDWTINLTGSVTLTTQTDKSGNYCFTRLPAGQYILAEGSRAGWYQTTPASGTFSFTLKPGESVVRMNFGNTKDPCFNEKKSWSAVGLGLNNWVETLATMNGKLFAGGAFTSAGGLPANRIAKWDGTNWSALGTGINVGWVATMAVKGSTLYAGGEFLSAGGMPSTYAIAKWDETGSTWSSLGTGTNSWVYALTVIDQQVYAKGIFTTAGGSPTKNIARWDGSGWFPLGSGINNSGFESSLTSSGSTLYAGGYFNSAGGVSANSIAKWDEANYTWSPLGSGVNGGVRALIEMGGELYAGGGFTMAGGVSANRIAKWNGSTWTPLGLGTNGPVFALAAIGSDLYVGGDFTMAGGITVNGIAKWDGTNWSSLGTGMGGPPGNNSWVNALTVIGSDLYAAGYFNSADGVSVKNIAKYTCGVPTSVGEGNNLQEGFILEQNIPNPFSSTSTIGYSISQTSQVKIIVHDLYGKEIKVLVNEEKEAGHHQIVFDRKDFASGIYFYTLRTAGFSQSKKMILMK